MKADVAGKPVQPIEVAGCDTIPRLFHRRVAEWGARTAFREKRLGIWRATSWHEYGDRAKWVGLGLVSLGLRRGEVVSILAETKPEWLYADMGVIGVGGVSNGIYPTDSSRQVEYILNDSGSRFLLVENEEQLDKYLDVRERCPQLRKVIVFDLEGLAAYRDPQVLAFDELLALGRNYETVSGAVGRTRQRLCAREAGTARLHIGHDRPPEGRNVVPSQRPVPSTEDD